MEFIERGTIKLDKYQRHTPWGTHEFGFNDLMEMRSILYKIINDNYEGAHR